MDQATSEIKSAQSRPELEKANAQRYIVDPRIAGWQRDLASYVEVGDFLIAQGTLAEALKSYRDALAIADRLTKVDPENAGWQHDLSLSYSKVGDVLMTQGNFAEAQKSYQDSLAVADRLAKVAPQNAYLQRDLAMSQGRVANVLAKQGDVQRALDKYWQGRAIITRLVTQSPDNGQLSKDLAAFDEFAKQEHASVPEIGSVKPVQVAPPLPNKKPLLATADVLLQGGI